MERRRAYWAPMSLDQFEKIPDKWSVLIFISDPFEPDSQWCQNLEEKSIKIRPSLHSSQFWLLLLFRFTSENLHVWRIIYELLLKVLLWNYHMLIILQKACTLYQFLQPKDITIRCLQEQQKFPFTSLFLITSTFPLDGSPSGLFLPNFLYFIWIYLLCWLEWVLIINKLTDGTS